MKKFIFFAAFFLCSFVHAQNSGFNPKASFGISTGSVSLIGNNFIAKTYDSKTPFKLDVNVNIVHNLGLGIDFGQWNGNIKTTDYVGNSTNGKFTNWGYYLHYYYQPSDKWIFVPKIGLGNFWVKNTLDNVENIDKSDHYYLSKGNSIFLAPEVNYLPIKNLAIFAHLQYQSTKMKVNGAAQTGTNYNNSKLLSIDIGIRLWKM